VFAILLNFISIALLVSLLSGVLMSIGFFLVRSRVDSFQPQTRRTLLWSIVLTPWLVGSIAASIALMSGTSFSLFPESLPMLHWHHVDVFEVFSWHGLLLLMVTSVYITGPGLHLLRTYNQFKKLRLLTQLGKEQSDKVYHLPSDKIVAFTGGYLSPRCFISHGILERLSTQERMVLVEHELAHVDRKDPLKKCIFQCLTANFPKSIRQELSSMMSLVIEQSADDCVTHRINDRSLIAATLLKVNRLILLDNHKLSEHDSTICHYGLNHVELRISNLLNVTTTSSRFPIFSVLSIVIVTGLFFAVSADLLHHLIEFSLSH
jgi:hypothetical protein